MACNKQEDDVELLSDVSMPSFMDDDQHDVSCSESGSSSVATSKRKKKGRAPPHPVALERKSLNIVKSPGTSLRKSVLITKERISNVPVGKSSSIRRSLAGPVQKSVHKHSTPSPFLQKAKSKNSVTVTPLGNITPKSQKTKLRHCMYVAEQDQTGVDSTEGRSLPRNKLKCKDMFEGEKENVAVEGQQRLRASQPRLRRQGTYEVMGEDQEKDLNNLSEIAQESIGTKATPQSKRGTRQSSRGLLGPENHTETKLKRQRTYDVTNDAEPESLHSHKKLSSKPNYKHLAKPSTADDEQMRSSIRSSNRLRRQGTFEVENSSLDNEASPYTDPDFMPLPKTPQVAFKSTPSTVVPSSVEALTEPKRASLLKSAPRILITSRRNPSANVKHPLIKTPGLKSPVFRSHIQKNSPSVVKEIEEKKGAVVAAKMANAGSSGSHLRLPKKIPDFSAIHRKQFEKMESLVDAKQRVLERANSMKKSNLPRCAGVTPKPLTPNCVIVPAKKNVARKLISPKSLRSKLVSPKPVSKHVRATPPMPSFPKPATSGSKTSALGQVVKGRLPSPKVIAPKFGLSPRVTGTLQPPKIYLTKEICARSPRENSRKDKMRAAVTSKLPVNRMENVFNRSKDVLKNVRLNKRFELQMQHRMKNQMA